MSVLYNQFSIIEVVTDLKTKTIVVATNFKVDPSTVDYKTVTLYDYNAGNGQLVNYSLQVDGKNICIILKDYPSAGSKYFLQINDIYDALNRKINHAYNQYITLEDEVITNVEVISPGYREVFNQNTIEIKLKITDPLDQGSYVVHVSSDNAFFKTIALVSYKATANEILSSNDIVEVSEGELKDGELKFKANINYNGQLFIRARAEKEESMVGKWSEISSFTIHTLPTESIDNDFLENSITTFDLFPNEFDIEPLDVISKSKIINSKDGEFFIEFNKEIKLPDDYKLNEDGYIVLDTIIGFRKELK